MKSRVQHLLDRAVALPIRRPGQAVVAALAVLGAAIWALLDVRLDPNIESLLGGDTARTYTEIARVFGWRERAYLLIEADRPKRADDLIACARRLADELAASPACERVEFGPSAMDRSSTRQLLFPYGLLLIDDVATLDEVLTPAGLAGRLEAQLDRLSMPGLGDQDDLVSADPLGLQILLAARLQTLRGGYRFAPGSPYFVSEDGAALLVIVHGRPTDGGSAAATELVATIEAAAAVALDSAGAAGLTVRGTGACYLADESQRTIRGDLIFSLSASIVLAILLLAAGLGMRIDRVALLCLPTLWGAAVGIGAFAWLRETVSALSFACAGILIGLGIDFTIHVTTAALHELAQGRRPAAALLRSFRDTRGRLALAAITSAAAFLAFMTSDAGFLRDMGLLTALGLAACMLSPFVLLPSILLPILRHHTTPPSRAMSWVARLAARPITVLTVIGVLTAGAAVTIAIAPPRFEDDLRNLHSVDSAPLATQARMGEVFGGSFEPLLVLVRGADEAAVGAACARLGREIEPLLEDATLLSATSIANVIPAPARQARTLALLQRRATLGLDTTLRETLDAVGFEVAEFEPYIAGFAAAIAVDAPVTPAALRERGLANLVDPFTRMAPSGAFGLVVLQPRGELWTGAARARIVTRARTAIESAGIDADLTGTLPTAVESVQLVATNFRRVSLLTIAAVLAVLLIRFRHPGRVALVLLPAMFGAVWVGATLSWTDQRLNLMNLGVIPMVLALGVDDGIHIFAHFYGGRWRSIRDVLQATGTGVVLTSVTTMVTFGSLALSSNRGLASVGTLSFIGIGSCLFASVVVLPLLLGRRANRPSAAGDACSGEGPAGSFPPAP